MKTPSLSSCFLLNVSLWPIAALKPSPSSPATSICFGRAEATQRVQSKCAADSSRVEALPLNRRWLLSGGLSQSLILTIPQRIFAFSDPLSTRELSGPPDLIDPSIEEPMVTDRAYFDLTIGGKPAGRLTFDLYGRIMPRTVENFLRLCQSTDEGSSYKGSTVFRVIPGLNIGMGDVVGGGDKCVKAKTCVSGFGGAITTENYRIAHTLPGLVSMARGLGDEIDSRIVVTVAGDARWADDRYSAFGRLGVTDGSMDVLETLQKAEVTGTRNSPKIPIVISECGILR